MPRSEAEQTKTIEKLFHRAFAKLLRQDLSGQHQVRLFEFFNNDFLPGFKESLRRSLQSGVFDLDAQHVRYHAVQPDKFLETVAKYLQSQGVTPKEKIQFVDCYPEMLSRALEVVNHTGEGFALEAALASLMQEEKIPLQKRLEWLANLAIFKQLKGCLSAPLKPKMHIFNAFAAVFEECASASGELLTGHTAKLVIIINKFNELLHNRGIAASEEPGYQLASAGCFKCLTSMQDTLFEPGAGLDVSRLQPLLQQFAKNLEVYFLRQHILDIFNGQHSNVVWPTLKGWLIKEKKFNLYDLLLHFITTQLVSIELSVVEQYIDSLLEGASIKETFAALSASLLAVAKKDECNSHIIKLLFKKLADLDIAIDDTAGLCLNLLSKLYPNSRIKKLVISHLSNLAQLAKPGAADLLIAAYYHAPEVMVDEKLGPAAVSVIIKFIFDSISDSGAAQDPQLVATTKEILIEILAAAAARPAGKIAEGLIQKMAEDPELLVNILLSEGCSEYVWPLVHAAGDEHGPAAVSGIIKFISDSISDSISGAAHNPQLVATTKEILAAAAAQPAGKISQELIQKMVKDPEFLANLLLAKGCSQHVWPLVQAAGEAQQQNLNEILIQEMVKKPEFLANLLLDEGCRQHVWQLVQAVGEKQKQTLNGILIQTMVEKPRFLVNLLLDEGCNQYVWQLVHNVSDEQQAGLRKRLTRIFKNNSADNSKLERLFSGEFNIWHYAETKNHPDLKTDILDALFLRLCNILQYANSRHVEGKSDFANKIEKLGDDQGFLYSVYNHEELRSKDLSSLEVAGLSHDGLFKLGLVLSQKKNELSKANISNLEIERNILKALLKRHPCIHSLDVKQLCGKNPKPDKDVYSLIKWKAGESRAQNRTAILDEQMRIAKDLMKKVVTLPKKPPPPVARSAPPTVATPPAVAGGGAGVAPVVGGGAGAALVAAGDDAEQRLGPGI